MRTVARHVTVLLTILQKCTRSWACMCLARILGVPWNVEVYTSTNATRLFSVWCNLALAGAAVSDQRHARSAWHRRPDSGPGCTRSVSVRISAGLRTQATAAPRSDTRRSTQGRNRGETYTLACGHRANPTADLALMHALLCTPQRTRQKQR